MRALDHTRACAVIKNMTTLKQATYKTPSLSIFKWTYKKPFAIFLIKNVSFEIMKLVAFFSLKVVGFKSFSVHQAEDSQHGFPCFSWTTKFDDILAFFCVYLDVVKFDKLRWLDWSFLGGYLRRNEKRYGKKGYHNCII